MWLVIAHPLICQGRCALQRPLKGVDSYSQFIIICKLSICLSSVVRWLTKTLKITGPIMEPGLQPDVTPFTILFRSVSKVFTHHVFLFSCILYYEKQLSIVLLKSRWWYLLPSLGQLGNLITEDDKVLSLSLREPTLAITTDCFVFQVFSNNTEIISVILPGITVRM